MTIEPIPFAGMVDIDLEITCLDAIIAEIYGKNPENVPKYVVLGDGSLYIFHKEEDRYALCEQAETVQERIPAAESEGGTACPQCEGACKVRDGQEGHRQDREGY